MMKNVSQFVFYSAFVCVISGLKSSNAASLPSYTCPESSEVIAAIAIQQNNQIVTIPMRFGLLQADLGTADVSHLRTLEFDHATFLFGNVTAAMYEVACAYRTPSIIFYTHSDYGHPMIYMGASPNWIPDSHQQYATCTYSANYCVFMKKPL